MQKSRHCPKDYPYEAPRDSETGEVLFTAVKKHEL